VPRPGLHASPVEYQPSVCNLIFKVGAGVHVQPVGMALGHHMGPSCWWQPGVYGSLRRWRAARAPPQEGGLHGVRASGWELGPPCWPGMLGVARVASSSEVKPISCVV